VRWRRLVKAAVVAGWTHWSPKAASPSCSVNLFVCGKDRLYLFSYYSLIILYYRLPFIQFKLFIFLIMVTCSLQPHDCVIRVVRSEELICT
jgi:hypothetical protein